MICTFLACPKRLKLTLKNEVKELYPRFGGVYERQYPTNEEPKANGYPYWLLVSNDECSLSFCDGVLWHDKDKSWLVGRSWTSSLGSK